MFKDYSERFHFDKESLTGGLTVIASCAALNGDSDLEESIKEAFDEVIMQRWGWGDYKSFECP